MQQVFYDAADAEVLVHVKIIYPPKAKKDEKITFFSDPGKTFPVDHCKQN